MIMEKVHFEYAQIKPKGLFVADSLWALQRGNLLPGPPSKEFLRGNPKSKKTSFIELLLARRSIVNYLLSLSGEQFLRPLWLGIVLRCNHGPVMAWSSQLLL